jgi:hypothetical protein
MDFAGVAEGASAASVMGTDATLWLFVAPGAAEALSVLPLWQAARLKAKPIAAHTVPMSRFRRRCEPLLIRGAVGSGWKYAWLSSRSSGGAGGRSFIIPPN